jgi:small conductance mechanosensitive channel
MTDLGWGLAVRVVAASTPSPSPAQSANGGGGGLVPAAVVDFLLHRLLPAAIFFVAIYLMARLARRVGDRWMRGRLEIEVALLVSRALYLGLLGLAAFAAGATLLVDVNAAVWGVLGAALLAGLGLQDLFRNYVSGFYVLLERNIRVGDQVETNGFTGVVTDVKMRVTYLKDDGRLIIVPNSALFNGVTVVAAPQGEPPASARPSAGESGAERGQDDPGQRGEVGPRQV